MNQVMKNLIDTLCIMLVEKLLGEINKLESEIDSLAEKHDLKSEDQGLRREMQSLMTFLDQKTRELSGIKKRIFENTCLAKKKITINPGTRRILEVYAHNRDFN